MVRYAAPLLSKEPANVYEYCLSQPTPVPQTSSRILSAAKSSTHLFLVGADCLVNVPLTILIPDDQYPRLGCNVYNWNIHSSSFSAVFNYYNASTFDIVFAAEVSTAAILQLVFNVFH